jgi:signal transduction histidine kinase
MGSGPVDRRMMVSFRARRVGARRQRDVGRAADTLRARVERLVASLRMVLAGERVPRPGAARFARGHSRRAVQVAVTLMTLSVVAVTELASRTVRDTVHPAPLLLACVVVATLAGGLSIGMASAAVTFLYEVCFSVIHGESLSFTLGTLILLGIAAPGTALGVGRLRARLERAERERQKLLHEQAGLLARELALKEANARMDAFLAMASHELRTPLTSLHAGLQLAERRWEGALRDAGLTPDEPGMSAVRDLLTRSQRQVATLTRLVNDLLDVTRIQANKLEIRPEPGELSALVRATVAEVCDAWPSRTVQLVLPEQPVLVEVDGDRIAQVIANYLTNALKYAPAERPIEVMLRVEGTQARVLVRDEGPGLAPEEQRRVWERFHQTPDVAQPAGALAGLGLGLHISRTIIECHQGSVGVESTPGQGATFWFTLPLAPARAPTRAGA